MTAAVYHLPDDVSVQRRQRWLAVGLSVLLHGLLALFLLGNRMSTPPPPPQIQTLETRLITLPPPPPEKATPAPAPEPVVEKPKPKPEPKPEPKPKKADVAWERPEPEPKPEPDPEPEPEPEPEPVSEPETPPQPQQKVAETAAAEPAPPAFVPEQVAASDLQSSYRPLSKAPPDYPRRALMRDVEGDCTVTYTVNKAGKVEELAVVKGDCHPLFEKPSLAAARQFRYSPHKIDGKAVAVTGVRNTFHYKLR